MALKTKIGKAEYEALNETLQSHYIEDDDGYRLDADYEDVGGLKAKNEELLRELKKRSDIVKQFEGLNPDEAKKALEQLAKIEEDKLLNKQKFDEVLARKQSEWEKEKAAWEQRYTARFEADATKDLQLRLAKHGVRDEYVEDVALVIRAKHAKPVDNNGETQWKSADGVSDFDFEKFLPELRTSKADYFKSTTPPGSGASGSGNGGGTGNTITRAQYDANPMQYAKALANRELAIVE